MESFNLNRDIPIEEDFDILVAGGGTAGSRPLIRPVIPIPKKNHRWAHSRIPMDIIFHG
jgi:hypothetical protein